MTYYGTSVTEQIILHMGHGEEDYHAVILAKASDAPIFRVTTCCEEDWYWEFWMDDPTNYEIVKHAIMSIIYNNSRNESYDMYNLMEDMNNCFADNFMEIVVDEDECDGDCENCEYCE